jgi:WD40 repeat protein
MNRRSRASHFSADDRLVSAGDDGTVRVWNIRTGATRTLRGHDGGVTRLVAQADAIASYGRDRQLRRWSATTGDGRVLRELAALGDLAFSPSGRVLAASVRGERQVYVWDGDQPRSRLEKDPVARLAFLDDEILVVGATNGSLRLRGPTGPPASLLGHRDSIAVLSVFARANTPAVASISDDAAHLDGSRARRSRRAPRLARCDHLGRGWCGRSRCERCSLVSENISPLPRNVCTCTENDFVVDDVFVGDDARLFRSEGGGSCG